MAKQTKKRNWALIAYPESLPKDWEQIITETGLPACISPLHDKDEKEDAPGELKKPHYHIILCYPGPTTSNTVKELAGRLNAPTWKPVESVKGAVRYQTHKDNPEKAQYDAQDMKFLNGFDPADYCDLTATELRQLTRQVLDIINKEGLFEYADLIDLLNSLSLQDADQGDLFDFATSHTFFLNNYLTSKRNKAEKAYEKSKKAFPRTKMVGQNELIKQEEGDTDDQ